MHKSMFSLHHATSNYSVHGPVMSIHQFANHPPSPPFISNRYLMHKDGAPSLPPEPSSLSLVKKITAIAPRGVSGSLETRSLIEAVHACGWTFVWRVLNMMKSTDTAGLQASPHCSSNSPGLSHVWTGAPGVQAAWAATRGPPTSP